MKYRFIILSLVGSMFLIPDATLGHELGFSLGGGWEIRNAYDVFTIAPYYSTATESNEPVRVNFFLPLALSIDTEDNDPPVLFNAPGGSIASGGSISAVSQSVKDAFSIGITPSVEWDIDLHKNRFLLAPLFGIGLEYQNIEPSSGDSIDIFSISVVPALQVKAVVNSRMVVRFAPFSLSISPWRYVDNDIGSDGGLSVTYTVYGGVSYLF